MRYAQIIAGIVENVAVGLPPAGDWMDLSTAVNGNLVGPGWAYSGGVFTAPPPPPAPPMLEFRAYTYSGFIDALTRPEALAILTGAKTDPLLEMFIEIARARSSVDFNDAATREAAPYLVASGVVTAERLEELIG